MMTRLDVDYVPAFTYLLPQTEPEDLAPELDPSIDEPSPDALSHESLRTVEALDDVSKNDVGFFMALAGQFELLSAERERELGLTIWI